MNDWAKRHIYSAAAQDVVCQCDAPVCKGFREWQVGGKYNMRTTPDTPAVWETTVFMFGTLKITCAATQEAILKVAAKYSRIPGYLMLSAPPNAKRKPAWMNMKRPADADAKLAALEAELAPDCDMADAA